MRLTKEWLEKFEACKIGIDFCIRNKLIGFPLDQINEVKGDYNGYISWLKEWLSFTIKYDSNNNPIHYKDNDGCEYWQEFDSNNNLIHHKDNNGYEYWQKYDSNNNLIHFKNSNDEIIIHPVEYYDDGQLKKYNKLEIPWFAKSD